MAQTSTEKYAATINGQITRITAASDLLATKVADFDLIIPASTPEAPTTTEVDGGKVVATSKIEDVAAALNQVNVQDFLEKATADATSYLTEDQILLAGGAVHIPVGYNKNAFTITAKEMDEQTYGTATENMLISGATAIGSTGKITGKLSLDPDKILKTQSWTSADGESKTGNIETYTGAQTINLNITPISDGNYICTSGNLNNGYYNNASITYTVSTSEDDEAKVFNVYKESSQAGSTIGNQITAQYGTLTTPDNYDYMVNRNYYVQNAATPSLVVTPNTGNVTVSSEANEDGKYALTGSITAKTQYGTEGWIVQEGLDAATAENVVFGYVKAADHTVESVAAYTNGSTVLTTQFVKDTTTDGFVYGETRNFKVQDAEASLSNEITGTLTFTPKISKNADTNVLAGDATTTKPTSGFYVAVASAENKGDITATGSCTLGKAGWISAAPSNATDTKTVGAEASATTYVTLTEGAHTYGAVTKGNKAVSTSLDESHYYIPCNTTEGYQTASVNYIDLGTEGSGDTLTTANTSKSIEANTYYKDAATVEVSAAKATLAGLTGANVAVTETAVLGDLTDNTTFVGTDNKFLSSFTVTVSDTIAALQTI